MLELLFMLVRLRDIAIAIVIAAFALAWLGLAPAASASPLTPFIDFRRSDFADSHGQRTFTANLDGRIVVRAEAFDPGADSLGRTPELFWDPDFRDGLGVGRDGFGGDERDEIDQLQRLVVSFPAQKLVLREIVLSDLFHESSRSGPEFGYYVLNDGNPYTRAVRFDASCAGPACRFGDRDNGELILTVDGDPEVSKITFFVNRTTVLAASAQTAAARFALNEFRSCFGSKRGSTGWTCDVSDTDADGQIGAADFMAFRRDMQASTAAIAQSLDPYSQVSEFSVVGLDGELASLVAPGEYSEGSLGPLGVSAVATPEPGAAVVFSGSLVVVSWALRRRGVAPVPGRAG